MGASKRSNYSAGSNVRNAGTEAARNLGVVLGLGGLSFFLGFFVLSRMVPDKHDQSGLAPAVMRDTPATPIQPPTRTPAPEPEPARHEAVASAVTPKRDDKAPIIEQDTEPATQSPGSLDRAVKPTPRDSANNAVPADEAAAGANAATGTNSATDTNPEAGGVSSTSPRTRRRSRSTTPDTSSTSGDKTDTGGFNQEDQKPSRIDRDASGDTATHSERHSDTNASPSRSERADTTGDAASQSVKTPRRVRYSVRGSAYSRREAAEREARRITDLGLDATVVPITTEDGTTVYRVQQGVYRNRSNAEKAKTALSDAGVEAEIVKTGGP